VFNKVVDAIDDSVEFRIWSVFISVIGKVFGGG
jgi:hypothetical protein